MMPLPVHELSIPAMLLAGLAMSPHCALMCGPVQTLQLRGAPAGLSPLAWLHLGRVLGYALMGAAAGLVGAQLMLWLPAREFSGWLQALAGAVLVLIGVSYLRRPVVDCHGHHLLRRLSGAAPSPTRLLARGLVWSLMPCALLYGLLFLATAGGGALSGALLMAAFGVGTVPLLAGGGQALQGLLQAPTLRRLTAVLLVSLGAASLGAVLAPEHFAPWCLPAQAMER